MCYMVTLKRHASYEASGPAESSSTAVRPLGGVEQFFWLIDQRRAVHFAATAVVSGRSTVEQWRQALDRVQKRHPLLSVRIAAGPGATPHFQHVAVAPIPLRAIEGEPETDWQREIAQELGFRFDPARAPLVRAVLIRGRHGAAFSLLIHHSITDGLGLAYVMRDLLLAMGGDPLPALPFPPAMEKALGLQKETPDAPVDGPMSRRHTVTAPPAPLPVPRVQSLQLSAGFTATLRQRARHEGSSIHGALCAAMILAGRKLAAPWRDQQVRLLSPVEARSLLGVDESCVVALGAAPVVFEPDATSFWEMARLVRTTLQSAKNREGIAQFAAYVGEKFDGVDPDEAAEIVHSSFGHEAMITNLGPLPFGTRFGPVKLEAFYAPTVLSGADATQTLGVASLAGSLCMSHASRQLLPGLLEIMRGILAEACLESRRAEETPILVREGAD